MANNSGTIKNEVINLEDDTSSAQGSDPKDMIIKLQAELLYTNKQLQKEKDRSRTSEAQLRSREQQIDRKPVFENSESKAELEKKIDDITKELVETKNKYKCAIEREEELARKIDQKPLLLTENVILKRELGEAKEKIKYLQKKLERLQPSDEKSEGSESGESDEEMDEDEDSESEVRKAPTAVDDNIEGLVQVTAEMIPAPVFNFPARRIKKRVKADAKKAEKADKKRKTSDDCEKSKGKKDGEGPAVKRGRPRK